MFKILAVAALLFSTASFAGDKFTFSFGVSVGPSTVREYVLVREGYWQETRIPATYSVSYVNGVRYETLVTPERCERVWVPARYEWVERVVYATPQDRYPVVVYPRPVPRPYYRYDCDPPHTHFRFGYRSGR